ncbi:Severe Depolymerization of Actin [Kickxella alabastrina]|uniref:Severe Depolymerization of Actin n=1 Tax=Kickxella alabastrina TaxID=61397 RepID=A0ACC1HVS2_9FUNG|nr:Severe Depolymerization of Actin [Kickxella alabastrina]
MYRKHKDKGVMMAARSLLALYREVNPEMLHRRDRGRDATVSISNGTSGKELLGYGESRVAEGVEGIELLEMYEQRNASAPGDGWDQWEVDSDQGSDAGNDSESAWVEADDNEDEAEAGGAAGDIIELGASSDEDDDEEEDIEIASDSGSGSEDQDDDDDVEESDSEVEDGPAVETEPVQATEKKRIDMIRFLTNEDFDRIDRLKKRQRDGQLKQAQSKKAKKNVADDEYSEEEDLMDIDNVSDDSSSGEDDDENKDYVEDWDILGDYHTRRRRRKASYEERVDAANASREGRDKFGSKKAKREKEGRSLSNKEKRKTKSFAMVSHKRAIVSKGRRSMVHKRHDLRRHITKQKKNGF